MGLKCLIRSLRSLIWVGVWSERPGLRSQGGMDGRTGGWTETKKIALCGIIGHQIRPSRAAEKSRPK